MASDHQKMKGDAPDISRQNRRIQKFRRQNRRIQALRRQNRRIQTFRRKNERLQKAYQEVPEAITGVSRQ